jgi:hypothetical protein
MKHKYIYFNYKLWIFKISVYFLGNKFSIRLEISSNNWDRKIN